MRAFIVSDIHFSAMDILRGRSIIVPEADVCLCAGDVSGGALTTIAYLKRVIAPKMPVVLAMGNHDYYHSSIDFALERARNEIGDSNIHLLEKQTIQLSGRRFIGATLWTDFAVSVGGDEHVPPEERRAHALNVVPYQIADFHCIFRSNERADGENGLITASEILNRHIASRSYINRELSKPFDGSTIVVTHHAPLPESFDPRFAGQVTNAAFASDLGDLIWRRKPNLWVHGHIHAGRDYHSDSTRVICNPVGYAHEQNLTSFRPGLVIDI